MAEALIMVISVGAIVLLMLDVRRNYKSKGSVDSGLFAFKVDIDKTVFPKSPK